MNTQQAYELMRVYLTREGARQATNGNGDCMYEAVIGGEVHRCAVGCLLTPRSLNSYSETEDASLRNSINGVEGLLVEFYVPELDDVDVTFLSGAQSVHDDGDNWQGGKFDVSKLDELAERFGLTVVADEVPEPVIAFEQTLTPA